MAVPGRAHGDQQILRVEAEGGRQGLAAEPLASGGIEGACGVAVLDGEPDIVPVPSETHPGGPVGLPSDQLRAPRRLDEGHRGPETTELPVGGGGSRKPQERAWARRLSKRFGCESRLDDRTFVLKGDGSVAGGLDFFAPKVKLPEGVDGHFGDFDAERGDRLVTFGWAMAEDLAGGKLGR